MDIEYKTLINQPGAVCSVCASYVYDRQIHTAWHEDLNQMFLLGLIGI